MSLSSQHDECQVYIVMRHSQDLGGAEIFQHLYTQPHYIFSRYPELLHTYKVHRLQLSAHNSLACTSSKTS